MRHTGKETILHKIVCFCLLGFAAALFNDCNVASSESGGKYEVIDTGIEGTGCWYDNSRFIALQSKYVPSSHSYQFAGLFYFDVNRAGELKPIDLIGVDPALRDQVSHIECQNSTLILSVPGSVKGTTRLYSVKIGEKPELVSDIRGNLINLKGQYVLGTSRKVIEDGGPLQGVFEGNDNCAISFLKPGFKALCWDLLPSKRWVLQKFVLTEYQWQDTIKVLGNDGSPKFVPNPATRLLGKDGKPINYALFLRDLNNQILVNLSADPIFAPVAVLGVAFNEDESYIYSACGKRGQRFDDAPYVCRYPLDGKEHQWEGVFEFLPTGGNRDFIQKNRGSILNLSLGPNGDIYFCTGGPYPYNGIWRFDARTKQFEHVTAPEKFVYDKEPKISPDGKKIAFIHSNKDELFIARVKGAAQ